MFGPSVTDNGDGTVTLSKISYDGLIDKFAWFTERETMAYFALESAQTIEEFKAAKALLAGLPVESRGSAARLA